MVEIANSKSSYLLNNIMLFSIGTIGTKLISFILIPLYTYYISTSEYGIIDIVSTTDWILIYILTLGIIDGFIRFALENSDDIDNLFVFSKNIIFIGFFVLVSFMILFRGLLPDNYPTYHYIFLIVIFILSALNDLILNYYKAKNKTEKVVIAGFLLTFINLIAAVITISILKLSGVGYYLSLCLGYIVSILYGLSSINVVNFVKIKNTVSTAKRREILRYSMPLSVNAISLWINNAIDKYFIVAICGEDANGMYSAAFKVPAMLSIIQGVFSEAWSLSAIKDYDNDDKDGFFKKAYNAYSAILVIGCSIIILINIPVTHLICLKGFRDVWKYSAFLVISVVFTALSGYLSGLLGAMKMSKNLAITTFAAAVVNIILNIILIPKYGIYGATIATIISCAVMFAMRCVMVSKKTNIKLPIYASFLSCILLFAQAIVEQMEGHGYIMQICIFLGLIMINMRALQSVIKRLLGVLKEYEK